MSLKPIELGNGANVVCRSCFLSICADETGSSWVHCHNAKHECKPGGPTVADPYILNTVM